ncbi:unnamed protein product [Amoebophrya sp. A25]|nr:unnamed protein product [Amoebophrya sp. A25]|eukprot:GSA25T00016034001.1
MNACPTKLQGRVFEIGDGSNTPWRRYELEENLGSGGFGTVHAAKRVTKLLPHEFYSRRLVDGPPSVCRDTSNAGAVVSKTPLYSSRVALKVIDESGPKAKRKYIERELAALRKAGDSPFLTHATDYFRRPQLQITVIVMPIAEYGSLADHAGYELLECEMAAIVSQISRGLHFLHSSNLVHRDIKPANILVIRWHSWSFLHDSLADKLLQDSSSAGAGPGLCVIQIADFGCSREASDDGGSGLIGTRGYLAPEVARGGPVKPSCDIYSLGCLFFEFFRPANEKAWAVVSHSKRLRELASPRALFFFSTMTQEDPDFRADAVDLLSSQFLCGCKNVMTEARDIGIISKRYSDAYCTGTQEWSRDNTPENGEGFLGEATRKKVMEILRSDGLREYQKALRKLPGLPRLNSVMVAMREGDGRTGLGIPPPELCIQEILEAAPRILKREREREANALGELSTKRQREAPQASTP